MYVCPVCALMQQPKQPCRGVLRIMLSYDKQAAILDRYSFHPYDLLPVDRNFCPNFPVGQTPLIAPDLIRKELGFSQLYVKDEGRNPTGSLKDRASFLVAAMAHEFAEKKIIVASTGNAASSTAGIAAASGLESIVFMPAHTPPAKIAQSLILGARVILVHGDYDDAYELSLRYTEKHGGMNRNTAHNPFTIEGKKTVSLEMFIQLEQQTPDMVFIPVGDGVILSGVYKGFFDLFQFDWIEKIPQLVAVQAEGSAAIVNGLTTGNIEPLTEAHTIADSIAVTAARNGILALKDIKSANGFGITVSDAEILAAQKYLGHKAGIFVEPAAACAFAGFLKAKDKIDPQLKVVVLLTGNGLKDIPTVLNHLTIPEPVAPDVDVAMLG